MIFTSEMDTNKHVMSVRIDSDTKVYKRDRPEHNEALLSFCKLENTRRVVSDAGSATHDFSLCFIGFVHQLLFLSFK